MKKRVLLIALLVLAAILAGCAGSAAETTEPACNHEWTVADCYNPKTCLQCGLTEGTAEHQYELAESVPATCTQDGRDVYYCSICDDPSQETIPSPGHIVDNGVCTVCGEAVTE